MARWLLLLWRRAPGKIWLLRLVGRGRKQSTPSKWRAVATCIKPF